ncbi:hypothetical protein ARTSIC4J27_263 [Pseudarthrobacter siccitolerans]|uniref:Uncharacterized protein n=1 Tax=Pseudarthrobacter siccitolerans TaxID=861266 RepID=A0A024GXW7_9MICC|nr:hypothetical protein [Pseudarthrobacter siccitolerans]CCQ44339.1 hypothetical protein ARTSIC4J27_263 [Pseudarthrobacter siccitolerans]
MTPQIRLISARNAGTPVRVTLDDGRVVTGVIERSLTEHLKIHQEGAARPTIFLAEDVIEVRPA